MITHTNRLIPYIPDTAPFSTEQRAWLNGYFAAMFSMLQPAGANTPTPQPEAKPAAIPITLVFGSQSGNCEAIAKRTAKALKQAGHIANVMDAAQFNVAKLQQTQRLLLITSTHGEGDPPDNILAFYAELHASQADLSHLSHLSFSVLALGDRNYTHFCKTGNGLDMQLSKLGANRLQPLVTCDVDYEANYKTWLGTLTEKLVDLAVFPKPARSDESTVTTLQEDRYSKANPFPAPIITNKNLHQDGAAHSTHHIEFSLQGSDLNYEAGDALGVMPCNDSELVDELLHVTNFDGNAAVPMPNGNEAPLREALLHAYDITKTTAQHVELLAERTHDEALLNLISTDNTQALREFLYGREWIDLLLAHPRAFTSPQDFVSNLRKLAPRLYSISSSPKAHAGQVHLTVSVVQYESYGRKRKGVCSNSLARAGLGATRPVFVHGNKQFKLPADGSAPTIMVGPGTGIAPFRAFLHERQATGATGKNWLFFGCWSAKCDFLYQDELSQLQSGGTLNKLDVAFSRDQAEKIYVQHLMQRNANELWAWLQDGAHFYVCGDAGRMAKDVDAALHEVAEVAGGLNKDKATEFVAELRKQKRYLRDVY